MGDSAMNGGRENQLDMEKDQAMLKFMHFILEVQVKNTYIYRYEHRRQIMPHII